MEIANPHVKIDPILKAKIKKAVAKVHYEELMRKKGINEILLETDNAKTTKKKVEILRSNWTPQLVTILKHFFDPNIKFVIPEEFKYKPNPLPDCEVSLYVQTRQLYLFVEGGHPTLTPKKRLNLFLGFLETLDAKDAELMVAMTQKKMPYSSITISLVREAFPDFLEKGDENSYYNG